MQALGKILIGILWIILIIVALLILTIFSWWMGWPLITGVVIIVCCIGAFLSFIALRGIWRWRNKHAFVKKVMEENKQSTSDVGSIEQGGIGDIWNMGVSLLSRTPGRKSRIFGFSPSSVSSTPCFLVFDARTKADDLFSRISKTLPERGNAPLEWSFSQGSVFLRLRYNAVDSSAAENLFSLMLQDSKRIRWKGIVLLLSCEDLNSLKKEELFDLGQSLCSLSRQCCEAMSLRYPIHLLVDGMEKIEGMSEALGNVSPMRRCGDFSFLLGSRTLADSCASAAHMLEDFLRESAAAGMIPSGNMLSAVNSLKDCSSQLESFAEPFSFEVAHHVSMPLRSLSFCARADKISGDATPFFLSSFCSRFLPFSEEPERLKFFLCSYTVPKLMGMAAWLVASFCLCGAMVASTIYQSNVLKTDNVGESFAYEPFLKKLYSQMCYIKQLENAHQAWLLPIVGKDMLLQALDAEKKDYVSKTYENLFIPMANNYQKEISKLNFNSKDSENLKLDITKEVLFFASIISYKIRNIDLKKVKIIFPLTSLNDEKWSQVLGDIIYNGISWMDDEHTKQFYKRVINLIEFLAEKRKKNSFSVVLDEANRSIVSTVSMSKFWPHVSFTETEDISIPAAYTFEGYKHIGRLVKNLEIFEDDSEIIKQSLEEFKRCYYEEYSKVWLYFIEKFCDFGVNIRQGEYFTNYVDYGYNPLNIPYVNFLNKISKNLSPLDNAHVVPTWYSGVKLANVLMNLAIESYKSSGSFFAEPILLTLLNSPSLIKDIRNEADDIREFREYIKTVQNIRMYFTDILNLTEAIKVPAKSLYLAQLHYGGDTKPEALEESPYSKAEEHCKAVLSLSDFNGKNPVSDCLKGMLHFISQGVTVQAARLLQKRWESDVLSSPVALYQKQSTDNALFMDKGLVQTFVDANLKPFLIRKDKVPAPAKWGDVSFPFTVDFLNGLAKAEAYAVAPPKSEYDIILHSRPASVNPDAKVRPDSVEVVLQCKSGDQKLYNRNYPHTETFKYAPDSCGNASLEVRFPSFSLRRNYTSFLDFIQEFEYGERVFSLEDFGAEAEPAMAAGVKKVSVKVLPDNVAEMLQSKENLPPALPDRIIYVW